MAGIRMWMTKRTLIRLRSGRNQRGVFVRYRGRTFSRAHSLVRSLCGPVGWQSRFVCSSLFGSINGVSALLKPFVSFNSVFGLLKPLLRISQRLHSHFGRIVCSGFELHFVGVWRLAPQPTDRPMSVEEADKQCLVRPPRPVLR